MKSTEFDLIVVGGGAAGLLAAGIASSGGVRTAIVEKNDRFGKKLAITGKGRCNVTNNTSPSEVIRNITTNSKFLYGAVNRFSPEDVINFFQRLGVPLKTERGRRVFPMSDKASDIVQALYEYAGKNGACMLHGRVTDIRVSDGAVDSVVATSGEFAAKNILLCTGGVSYPGTGSTGDGYSIAKKLGHSVIPPKPSLVPLEERGNICSKMSGLSLRNVAINVKNRDDKCIYQDQGELMFTHFGLTGPIILSASAHMRDYEKEHYHVDIDLKPALDEKKLDARLLRDFAKFSNRDFANSLSELVPHSLIPVLVDLSGIQADTKVNSITREQRKRFARLLKCFRIDIRGARPISEAIVTAGGINVKEIDPRTMESKLVHGLYFAGEIIDVDAYTGGFNLQIAWSTAYAAASAIIGGYE